MVCNNLFCFVFVSFFLHHGDSILHQLAYVFVFVLVRLQNIGSLFAAILNGTRFLCNGAQATAFIFDSRTDVLDKTVEVYGKENASTLGRLQPLTFEFIPNSLPFELPGQTYLPCYLMFWNTGVLDIFVFKVNIWNVNSAYHRTR